MIRLIAAIDRQRGIAKSGIQPWSIPDDEKYFTEQTKSYGGNVLTGGRTFRESYHGPLADRYNFILTHDQQPLEGATIINDLDKFLKELENDLWVAGGALVYEQIVSAGFADELYLTHIDADFGCDQHFPDFSEAFSLLEQGEWHEQNGFHFSFARYSKKVQ